MDIQTLTDFFMWCSIINGSLFVFSAFLFMLIPDFVYSVQSKFFPITRENFNTCAYTIFGMYKVMVIFFNIVPYAALVLMS